MLYVFILLHRMYEPITKKKLAQIWNERLILFFCDNYNYYLYHLRQYKKLLIGSVLKTFAFKVAACDWSLVTIGEWMDIHHNYNIQRSQFGFFLTAQTLSPALTCPPSSRARCRPKRGFVFQCLASSAGIGGTRQLWGTDQSLQSICQHVKLMCKCIGRF